MKKKNPVLGFGITIHRVRVTKKKIAEANHSSQHLFTSDGVAVTSIQEEENLMHVTECEIQMQDLTWGQFFFFCCLWDSSDAFLFLRQYKRRPDCSGALRRNNHCHSKFICFAITVNFGEVVRHQSSEMFTYTLITAALWPFVCLLKSLFPICMEICRRPTLTGRRGRLRMDILSIDWTVYEARWRTTQTW